MHKTRAYAWMVYLSLITGGLLLLPACFKNITRKNLIYENNFNNGDLKGILLYNNIGLLNTPKIEFFNGSNVLGRFNNNLLSLTLANLPDHNAIQVEFDLYIHDKWDGNFLSSTAVPDLWVVKVDDNLRLLTTFSNTSYKQSYPYFYPGGNNPAKANAIDTNLLGVCSLKDQKNGTSHYRFATTYAHDTGVFKFDCSDALQPFNDLCLKSWSVDNMRITAFTY